MENNKLIAEFMGAKPYKEKLEDWWTTPPYAPHGFNNIMLSGMKYEYSWDWLMPVVEKIESLKETIHSIDVQITIDRVAILVNATPIYVDIRQWSKKSKIESVYSACIAFIEWYNENK